MLRSKTADRLLTRLRAGPISLGRAFLLLFLTLIVSVTTISSLRNRVIYYSAKLPTTVGLAAESNEAASISSYIPSLPKHTYAFVGYLGEDTYHRNFDPSLKDDDDIYFVATRVLTYQLLHDPETRTNTSIPFIILCTPGVQPSKIARLRKDGAYVLVVDRLERPWIHTSVDRWQDIFIKLHAFELTNYEKVLFLDSDMLITRRMDGVFSDPATTPLPPKPENTNGTNPSDAPLPSTYVLAGQVINDKRDHPYPPPPGDYFGGGFFVAQPSLEISKHYTSLMDRKDSFDPYLMEQSLLNHAHRREGPMPWTDVEYTWTTTWPSRNEYEKGAASLHEKWWRDDLGLDEEIRELWWKSRWEMVGYYRAKDGGKDV